MFMCRSLAWFTFSSCFLLIRGSLIPNMEKSSRSENLFELSIIHFNDFHARFEQTSTSSGTCPKGQESTCIGGIARLYSQVMSLLSEGSNTILLNAGDVFQGTLWYTLFKWRATAEFMNKLPHDAMTLGNHEFDDGIEGVVPFLKNISFPVVVANIDDSDEPDIQGLYNKSTVIERSGRKIGIIGYIISTTNEISSTGKLKFLDEVETVKAEATQLKNQGIDIIICLSHAGYDIDKRVAANVPDIDIIVGGHSHTLLYTGTPPSTDSVEGPYPTVVMQESGHIVLVVQASAYTKYLGNLTVNFDDSGETVSWGGNPIYLTSSLLQDADIVEAMEPYKERVEAEGSKTIGSTNVLLSSSCSSGECNLGSLLTDAMVEEYVTYAPENSWTLAPIGIINSGGIRTSIVETNNGVITYNDLVTSQPFSNTIDYLELQGKHLLQVLEQSVSNPWSTMLHRTTKPEFRLEQSANFSGYGFLQLSGIHVTFNISKSIGERVQEVSILCDICRIPEYEPLDEEKWYHIACNSFLASGGDGYNVIAANRRNYTAGKTDVDVFLEYLKKHDPVIQGLDGRIKMIQEGN